MSRFHVRFGVQPSWCRMSADLARDCAQNGFGQFPHRGLQVPGSPAAPQPGPCLLNGANMLPGCQQAIAVLFAGMSLTCGRVTQNESSLEATSRQIDMLLPPLSKYPPVLVAYDQKPGGGEFFLRRHVFLESPAPNQACVNDQP